MKKIGLIYLLLMMVMCKKEEVPTKLPDLTQNGANTFGCKINNEIYIPEHRKVTIAPNPIIIEYPNYPNYFFSVSTNRVASNSDSFKDASISFSVMKVLNSGDYIINYGTVKFNGLYYKADTSLNNSVKITFLDTIQHIISGTFNFSAINEYNNNDIVKVTEGRFDLKKE